MTINRHFLQSAPAILAYLEGCGLSRDHAMALEPEDAYSLIHATLAERHADFGNMGPDMQRLQTKLRSTFPLALSSASVTRLFVPGAEAMLLELHERALIMLGTDMTWLGETESLVQSTTLMDQCLVLMLNRKMYLTCQRIFGPAYSFEDLEAWLKACETEPPLAA